MSENTFQQLKYLKNPYDLQPIFEDFNHTASYSWFTNGLGQVGISVTVYPLAGNFVSTPGTAYRLDNDFVVTNNDTSINKTYTNKLRLLLLKSPRGPEYAKDLLAFEQADYAKRLTELNENHENTLRLIQKYSSEEQS